tara:strand:- start:221 stop:745 length:525 start_codon:yes stop_codon:yes gene_type:complete
MLISTAFAQDAAGAATQAPMDPTIFNLGLIFVLFILFYFLLIRPQNKRMKEQRMMLDGLQKGDRVVTAGGIIGTISNLVDEREVELELSKGVKVMALRYTIQDKMDGDAPKSTPANDSKSEDKSTAKPAAKATAQKAPAKKTAAKKPAAKKTTSAAKKPAAKKTAAKKSATTDK